MTGEYAKTVLPSCSIRVHHSRSAACRAHECAEWTARIGWAPPDGYVELEGRQEIAAGRRPVVANTMKTPLGERHDRPCTQKRRTHGLRFEYVRACSGPRIVAESQQSR